MALLIKYLSGETRGKSRWELVLVEGAKETVLAHSPGEFNTVKGRQESIDRLKAAVQIEFIEE